MKDKCILCDADTAYDNTTHVDMRVGYIEGAGQLCHACWMKGTDRRHFLVPHSLVYNNSNDAELGAKVRELYYSITD